MPTGIAFAFRLSLLLAITFATGCTTPRRAASQVAVTLSEVRIAETGAFETRLAVRVRYTNRGPDPVEFTGSRHELSIQSRLIGLAVNDADLTLPGLSTTTQDVELTLSNFALVALARDLQRDPQARYEIESTLFGIGHFGRKVRTRADGVIDLRNLTSIIAP